MKKQVLSSLFVLLMLYQAASLVYAQNQSSYVDYLSSNYSSSRRIKFELLYKYYIFDSSMELRDNSGFEGRVYFKAPDTDYSVILSYGRVDTVDLMMNRAVDVRNYAIGINEQHFLTQGLGYSYSLSFGREDISGTFGNYKTRYLEPELAFEIYATANTYSSVSPVKVRFGGSFRISDGIGALTDDKYVYTRTAFVSAVLDVSF